MTRFVRFNVVGAVGLGLQLAVLATLERAGWPIVAATLIAVEAAVLHNFVWHERWTWKDARAGSRAGRLARFHVTNGLVSLAGNAWITYVLVAAAVPAIAANVAAVAACSAINFAAAHWLVFCAKTWHRFPWAPSAG
jgi:putative flippase GtrA